MIFVTILEIAIEVTEIDNGYCYTTPAEWFSRDELVLFVSTTFFGRSPVYRTTERDYWPLTMIDENSTETEILARLLQVLRLFFQNREKAVKYAKQGFQEAALGNAADQDPEKGG